ncbi:ADP-ribose pyrophosphatase [Klebsormidium nitens]|uniref:ADP-ribose pyrophosphatase n=1 Tax=Klebsormidium nitens TaxID=105231 RepID=A0A1Y1II34_KLENI|nr:ADP-ribose pyrophosphatase [Klebsormidium nitens]|eukprot:GAQ88376.1 ADP-ribose pyrophosphatase [Klebsormidium nitens]
MMARIAGRAQSATNIPSLSKRNTLANLGKSACGLLESYLAGNVGHDRRTCHGWGSHYMSRSEGSDSGFTRATTKQVEVNEAAASSPASAQECNKEAEKPVPVVKESHIVLDAFLKVRSETLLLPDGKTMDYLTVLSRPTAVVILAFTPDNKLVLTQEYRHPTGKYLLSSPGGLVDPNEDPLTAAARELREETGYEATEYAVIGESWPAPGIIEQKVIFVAAKNAIQKGVPALEGGEMLCTHLRSLEEARSDILAGMPTDGILLTGLWYLEHGEPLVTKKVVSNH